MSEREKVYLAFDLGATSWRATLGIVQGANVRMEEIHRQDNIPIRRDDGTFWDIHNIFDGIKHVLKDVGRRGIELSAIGFDSWSIDYALLDADGELLELPRSYRDPRNEGMMEQLLTQIDADELFARTGLMFEDITTLCQLLAAKKQTPELLDRAASLLMITDLLRFWLCGEQATDFTLAITTQFYDPWKHRWDTELLSRFALPTDCLPKIYRRPAVLGRLSRPLQSETGLGPVPITIGASHDTAAAFSTVPPSEDCAILSSGTWSILGVHTPESVPVSGIDPRRFGYEGNPDGSLRLIHNVAGMYLLEQCRAVWKRQGLDISYDALIDGARKSRFKTRIDPYSSDFFQPEDMTQAIASHCRQAGRSEPKTPVEFARSIFMGLAHSYAQAIDELRTMTDREIKTLVVIGGGARNTLLNEWTAEAANVTVRTGEAEATTLGNILSQQWAVTGQEASI